VYKSPLKKKTPWPESLSELYRPPLVGEVMPTFADRGYHVVSVTDPYGRNLAFLDHSRYVFFKVAPQCTHEAEWTPFQTHCFSENLVVRGIEPGLLDL
jgi:hypothetical protein